jgi:alpha-tubulin suppressor-like RCC1 family protein
VATGDNSAGQCDVSGWTGIVQVAAGSSYTVGVKSDGTVVAVGYNDSGQCNVADWTDIVQVAAGWSHTVGLKSDGTVVAVGLDYSGQCDVGGWTDIVQVAAGWSHTVGLKSDGTVVAAGLEGELAKWNLGVTGSAEKPPANWPLIGGIIAVVAVGLVIFFVRRRRVA